MTLRESTERLKACFQSKEHDPDALNNAIRDRARAIAEFAAIAALDDLLEARAAGELCMQTLREARRDLLTEMMQTRKFHDLLELGGGFSRTRIEPNRLLG